MKNYFLFPAFLFLIVLQSCQNSPENDKLLKAEFKVWGNCSMCKETIENSLKGQQGLASAEWDIKSKTMTIKYDSTASLQQVHKKIASAGYDTELEKGDDGAYSKLHSCCQYKRKE